MYTKSVLMRNKITGAKNQEKVNALSNDADVR